LHIRPHLDVYLHPPIQAAEDRHQAVNSEPPEIGVANPVKIGGGMLVGCSAFRRVSPGRPSALVRTRDLCINCCFEGARETLNRSYKSTRRRPTNDPGSDSRFEVLHRNDLEDVAQRATFNCSFGRQGDS
jgi:hypothetical protein